MNQILRPRFGQPCFSCESPVPAERVRRLREHAETRGRVWLKSDLLCVDCQRLADSADRGIEPTRPTRR